MTDLQSLLTRLETATGPSQALDGLIALRIDGWAHHFGDAYVEDWAECGGHWLPPGKWHVPDGPFKCRCRTDADFDEPPEYTASLDAALALVEGVLPASNGYDLSFVRGNDKPYDVRLYGTDGAEVAVFEADAWTPALALLTALVRVLIAAKGNERSDAELGHGTNSFNPKEK